MCASRSASLLTAECCRSCLSWILGRSVNPGAAQPFRPYHLRIRDRSRLRRRGGFAAFPAAGLLHHQQLHLI